MCATWVCSLALHGVPSISRCSPGSLSEPYCTIVLCSMAGLIHWVVNYGWLRIAGRGSRAPGHCLRGTPPWKKIALPYQLCMPWMTFLFCFSLCSFPFLISYHGKLQQNNQRGKMDFSSWILPLPNTCLPLNSRIECGFWFPEDVLLYQRLFWSRASVGDKI